jgi:hypothetical protein
LPKKSATVCQKIFKVKRKRAKEDFEAKKATNEAIKIELKRKRDEAREGAPYLIKLNKYFISFFYIIDKFLAKSEHSTPNVATEHPHSRFKIYDMVYSTPDTTPGCDSSQSVALYGSVIALKFEDELMVKIKSSNDAVGSRDPS